MIIGLDAQLAFLEPINAEVNAIPYEVCVADDSMDAWFDAPIAGHAWECRCYAAMKGRLMRERGWDNLRMGFVLCNIKPPTREYHAVQFAATDGGIYIMDNRVLPSRLYRWDQPVFDYEWLWQQVPGQLDNAGRLVWRDARGGLV